MRLLLCSLLIVVYCAHTGTRAVETNRTAVLRRVGAACLELLVHAALLGAVFVLLFLCFPPLALGGPKRGPHDAGTS